MKPVDPASVVMPSSNMYGLPLVGRFGLAHSLLAWARCELWCRDHSVPMLAPNWNHLRIGPYLRRERDKREYHRLFNFPGYISGLRRAWLLLSLPRYPVDDAASLELASRRGTGILVFSNRYTGNFEHHFHEVAGRAPELRAALHGMTKPKYRPASDVGPHIAVHVRQGDFSTPANDTALREGVRNSRLPIHWYAHALTALRTALGHEARAIVYSDGQDEALAPLLAMNDVRRSTEQSAVTDLLSIAQASILISSGSGFSIWGSFLGGVPRICYPGQRIVRVLGASQGVDLEPELRFDECVPADFAAHVAERFH